MLSLNVINAKQNVVLNCSTINNKNPWRLVVNDKKSLHKKILVKLCTYNVTNLHSIVLLASHLTQ